jgi:ATP-dependent Clp protease protease subunit
MTDSSQDPAARFPYQPPEPEPDPRVPAVEGMAPWLQERLFDRRIVVLGGPVTAAAASHAAAALVTLDMLSADPVHLHVNALDGELSAAFAVVDAMDSMRAKVEVIVPSQVGGAALAILAAATRRLAYRHARVRLSEPRAAMASGTAEKVAAAAGEYLRELDELIVRLADVTAQPRSRIEDDLSAGRTLTAVEAKEYGLIDDIVGPGRH